MSQGGSKHLTPEERALVLKVEKYFLREKEQRDRLEPVTAVQQRTVDACQISLRTLRRIHAMERDGVLTKENKKRRLHSKSLDLPAATKYDIRNVIYDMYKAGEFVTRDVLLQKLREKEICNIGKTALSKLLRNLGFRFQKTCNRKTLCELSSIVGKRWEFLQKYVSNMESNNRQVVFLDETCIFAKGNSSKCSCQGDTNICYSNCNSSAGKKYIVVDAGNSDGFIKNACLIFRSTKTTNNHHDNMNAELFEKWFENNVLKSLEKPSLIILDNAAYHSRIIEDVPNSSWCKDDIREWLSSKNADHENLVSKADLLTKVKELNIPKRYVVDALAQLYGHEVLRLPPYHFQFNPIEMVWGICKNYYDGFASQTTNEESVLRLWNEALFHADKNTWRQCISHVEKLIHESYLTEQIIDEVRPLIISVEDTTSDDDSSQDEL